MNKPSKKRSGRRVYEIEIRDEGNREGTMFLCSGCTSSIADFATVVSKKPAATSDCDRCGDVR